MKSILVIGMGRFGRHLAKKMQELGNDVMVVDKNEEIIQQYSTVFTDAQIADCTNDGVIRSLGVDAFDICFVTIGSDFQSSLVVTTLLKRMGAKYVVAKAKQDIQLEILKQIGADEIVYPERETAEKLAVQHNQKNIFDFIQLTSQYSIYEIAILKEWVGKSIKDIDIRRKYNVNIIAVKEGNNVNPAPDAEYIFLPNDHIVVIGKSTDVFELSSKE